MSWSEVDFESLFEVSSRNGVYKSKDHHGSGVSIVNMGELFAFSRISDQPTSLIRMSDAEMDKNGLIDGDLLFGRRSLVEEGAGKCSLVYKPSKPMTFESSIIRVRLNQTIADPEFFFNYFRSPVGRGRIRAIVGGATIKGIRGSDLRLIKVHLPPVYEQIAIRQIVSTYDDLIATNQRRIALLEEAARRIYREWFVALRFPGHESVPVKDGVPEEWDFDVVGMFGKVETGKTPSTSNPDFFGGEIPFIKTPDMHGRMVTSSALQTLSNSGSDSQKNKLLPVGSVAVSCIGTVGVVSIIGQPSHTNQQINAIIPHKNFYRVYLYFTLSELREYMLGLGGGSTMANISKSKFANMPILKPNDDVLSQFEEIVTPMVSQIEQLESACVKLVQARDLLLPKLMSGQLDVSNISLPDEVAL
ncbi:restriction endonuclease subunit S [uncultured Tolumonas sp.]|uniref:restriction endonuclease subunit S n=1 Tax=uncultured Tolumonas sp. TaxID=263765 RepID=UPI002A0A4FFD|nr:restriction endonuclease subunit S [uncultured Tolumonas sp.]